MAPTPSPRRALGLRGFTLIELIVVILILGILAAVAVVGYTQVTQRAQETAANADLKQIATAVLAHHTLEQAPQLSREEFLQSLDEVSVDVVDGLGAAAQWTVYGMDTAPAAAGDFAVGFDWGSDTAVNDDAGTRAVVVTHAGSRSFARVIVYGAADVDGVDGSSGEVPPGTTPIDVLDDPTLIDNPRAHLPGNGGDGNGDPGDGQGNQQPAFGTMDATLAAYNLTSAEAADYGLVSNEIASGTVWAPAGTSLSNDGLKFDCTTDSPVPGAGVKVYWDRTTEADGRVLFYVDWSGNSRTVKDVGRTYTCTYTAYAADGTALASRTLSNKVGTDATTTPPTPEENTSGYTQVKITAADGQSWNSFGSPVAIDGNTMITGAPGAGGGAGAVYIHTRSNGKWTLQQRIDSPLAYDNSLGGTFGTHVALDANTAVVTDSGHDKVYVYVRSGSTWTQQGVLYVTGIAGGFNPEDVAISGDNIVIGSRFSGADYSAPGMAFVFHRTGTTWNDEGHLFAVDSSPSLNFGQSVDVSGDTVAVGAPSYASQPNKDSVTIFTRNGGDWSVQATLNPDAPYFGTDVALDGNTLAVLASDQNYEGQTNSLYVYTRSGSSWSQQDRVTTKMGGKEQTPPRYVDLSGGTAVVGYYYSYYSGDKPHVAVFNRSGSNWSQTTELWPIPNAGEDGFSEFGLSMDGASIAVGAYADNERADGAGAVYVFTPQP